MAIQNVGNLPILVLFVGKERMDAARWHHSFCVQTGSRIVPCSIRAYKIENGSPANKGIHCSCLRPISIRLRI